jgi:hypothetical protein
MIRSMLVILFLVTSLGAVSADENPLVVEQTSEHGNVVRVEFPESPLKRGRKTLKVCTERESELLKAVLWMPDMNHGSSPTQVKPLDPHCSQVERVNFMMGGRWEIRLEFAGNDRAVITVDVEG